MDYTKLSNDRLPLDFHEGDENGYIYTPSGGAEGEDYDDKALWVGAVLYVEYPEHTLERMREDEDSPWHQWRLTKEEERSFIPWITKQYPKVPDFVDSGDDRFLYAEFTAHYEEGETTDQLLYRLCVLTSAYTEIRNDWEILFNGFHDFMDHIKAQRERRVENAQKIIDEWVEDPDEDFNTGPVEFFGIAKYAVCFEEEGKQRWVNGYESDRHLAAMYAHNDGDDGMSWYEHVYDLDTGEIATHKYTKITTVTINDNQYTF